MPFNIFRVFFFFGLTISIQLCMFLPLFPSFNVDRAIMFST